MRDLLETFAKVTAPWLGLSSHVSPLVGRMILKVWTDASEATIDTEHPDIMNAAARDLILDALEAKGLETSVIGLPPGHERPAGRYQCDVETSSMGWWMQAFGDTRTEAVLRAANAAATAAKEVKDE